MQLLCVWFYAVFGPFTAGKSCGSLFEPVFWAWFNSAWGRYCVFALCWVFTPCPGKTAVALLSWYLQYGLKRQKCRLKINCCIKKLCAGLGLYHFGPLCQGLQPVKECLLFVRFVQRCPGAGVCVQVQQCKNKPGDRFAPGAILERGKP